MNGCARCGLPVDKACDKISANQYWHRKCFTCCDCKQCLNSNSAKLYRGDIFCTPCFERMDCRRPYRPYCNICRQERDCCREVHSCSCIPHCAKKTCSRMYVCPPDPCSPCKYMDGCCKDNVEHCYPRSARPCNYPPRTFSPRRCQRSPCDSYRSCSPPCRPFPPCPSPCSSECLSPCTKSRCVSPCSTERSRSPCCPTKRCQPRSRSHSPPCCKPQCTYYPFQNCQDCDCMYIEPCQKYGKNCCPNLASYLTRNCCEKTKLYCNPCNISPKCCKPCKTINICRPCDPCEPCDPCCEPYDSCRPCDPCRPCNPCDPCSKPCKPYDSCRPCDPCRPCNPCDPCVKLCDPCDPCKVCCGFDSCDPCNPCRPSDPCKPCKPCDPCDPCNKCKPCRPCSPYRSCKRNFCRPCSEFCPRCGEIVYAAEKVRTTVGSYHIGCFCCACCGKILNISSVYPSCGEIFCKQCYNNQSGLSFYGRQGDMC